MRNWVRRDRQSGGAAAVEQQQDETRARNWSRRDGMSGGERAPARRGDQVRIGQYNEAVRVRSVRPSNSSPIMTRIARDIRQNSPNLRNDWNNDWRHDRRYDWRRYRDYNRSIFYLGSYYDPWGYGYNRFQIGWSLWPSYYGQNYWINDPWMYRLPPAYGPYRWVRYWDDALLVNTYTGEVVDVVYDFFW